MNRSLRNFATKMGEFYIPFLGILLTILIIMMGYQHVQPKTYNFQLNQVAEDTILAPYTIEDLAMTEQNRKKARESINDIYVYQEDIRSQQILIVEKFFGKARQMRSSNFSKAQIKEMMGDSPLISQNDRMTFDTIKRDPKQEVAFDNLEPIEKKILYQLNLEVKTDDLGEGVENLALSLHPDSKNQVVNISVEDLSHLQNSLTRLLSERLIEEIDPSQMTEVMKSIENQINQSNLAESAKLTTLDFMSILMKPTMVFSKNETERIREETASQVQPSYILQGQVIVQKGHIINQNNMRQLDLFGYLNKDSKTVLSKVFYGLVIFHSLLMSLFFGQLHLNGKRMNLRSNLDQRLEATAYAISLAVGLLLIKFGQVIQTQDFHFAGILSPVFLVFYLINGKVKLKTKLVLAVFMNLFGLFIVNDNDNQSVVIFITLFYLFSSLIALLNLANRQQEEVVPSQCFFRLTFWHYLIVFPLMVALSIPILSEQGLAIVVLVFANMVLGIFLLTLITPYWEQLMSTQAPMTLNQLANLNHPLLKLLIEKAPGTYHHSIMVANLAANAVEEIGGDSLLTRVASYYHDVGKTVHPLFFAENLSGGIESPHRMVGPQESAKIIIDHVAQGVALLEAHHMPQSIIEFCQQHHGTTLTQYFYHQAKQEKLNVTELEFRYPGPKPQTKEIMIMMLADSIEAASRTMKEHNQKGIEDLVDGIIKTKTQDGQFSNSLLTVEELRKVRRSLILGVASMYHTRVEYPK